MITENHPGNLEKTILGLNKNLNGKRLTIVATIADTSRETNTTSLLIDIRGGFMSASFPLAKVVEKEGQSADYLCLIEFFKPWL